MHLYVSLYILVCLVFSVLCSYVFVLGCGSLSPNEDIVRFRCGWGGESYTLFAHIFVKNFHFLYIFLGFGVACAFFIGLLSLFAWLHVHV